jgi:hypothetical protein
VVITDAAGKILHVDRATADPERTATVLSLLNDMKSDGRMAETART